MVFFKKKDKDKERRDSRTNSLSNSTSSLPTLSPSPSQQEISLPPDSPTSPEAREKIANLQTPKNSEDVEATFLKLLHALGIPHDKQTEMMKYDVEKKMHLIQQHKKGAKKLDPQAQVSLLKNLLESTLMSPQDMRAQMAKVRQCITSSLVSWVVKFISVGGFHVLLDILRKAVLAKVPNAPVIAEGIMMLKSLMNTPAGMKITVETPAMYKLVITSISICGVSSEPPPTDVVVARQISQNGMDVLTAVGLVPPDGHRLVLEAANTLDRNPRFYWLLRELWANIPLMPESTPLLVSGMSLINVIVNSPDELRVRVVLRNELFALGLDGLLWALSESQAKEEKLGNQLTTFTYLNEDDMYELETRFGSIAQDPVDLVKQLVRKLERTPVYTSLVSVLHNLATISGGKVTPSKVKCWRHIETSINRIVLHDIGSTMDVDISHLNSILNKNEFGNTVPMPWAEYREQRNSISDSNGAWVKVDIHNKGKKVDLPRSASDVLPNSASMLISDKRRSRNVSISKMNGTDGGSSREGSEAGSFEEDASEMFSLRSASSSSIEVRKRDSTQITSDTTPTSSRPNSVTLPPLTAETTEPPNGTEPPPPPAPPNGLSKSISAPVCGPPPPPPRKSALTKNLINTTKPKNKTKQLQWKKVPESKIASAPFWAKATHLDLAADAAFIEAMFLAKETKARKSTVSIKGDRGSTNENGAGGEHISILDPKRSHNIEIMLSSRLKRHPRVISEAILTLNDSLIDAEGVNQILKSLPSEEEVKKLHGLSLEDIPKLGKAEVFLLELLKVPRLQNKLECWMYMIAFDSVIEEVIPALTCVCQASDQIMNSKKFAHLLHLILAFGNFLNAGGGQGNALGFKLDGLTKLRDVKTADNKGTLLNVLAQILENRQPEILDFFHDMPAVEEARKVNNALLKAKVQSLKTGFAAANTELAQETLAEQVFMDKVSAFIARARPKIEEIGALVIAMDKAYNSLLNYYGEDLTMQSEDLFEMFAKFATMLAAAHADNESRRRREEYQAKRSMRNIAPPTADASKPGTDGARNRPPANPRENPHVQAQAAQAVESGIDSILQDIHTGGVHAIVARRPTLDTDVLPNLKDIMPPSPRLGRPPPSPLSTSSSSSSISLSSSSSSLSLSPKISKK